jgi:COMPASS component SPP1
MQLRLHAWTRKGGKKDKLWDSVNIARRREGVVVEAPDIIVVKDDKESAYYASDGAPRKFSKEISRLNELLSSIVSLREETKKGLDAITWREKLLELASERAEQLSECGWDQRLCFGDEECTEFGASVLETYEASKQDDPNIEGFGAWWCPGKKACDRHAG